MMIKRCVEFRPIEDKEIHETLKKKNLIKAKLISLSRVPVFEQGEIEPFFCEEKIWKPDRWIGTVKIGDEFFVRIVPRIGWKRFYRLIELSSILTYGFSIEGSFFRRDRFEEVQIKHLIAIMWLIALQEGRKIHTGAVKGYVKKEDRESVIIRGRIDFSKQYYNELYGKAHLIACNYMELSYNVSINKSIMFVIDFLKRYRIYPFEKGVAQNYSWFRNVATEWARRLMEFNVEIPSSYPEGPIKWDRTNGGYKKAYELGRILIKGYGEGNYTGEFSNILLDSAEVWEIFLYWLLRGKLKNEKIRRIYSPRIEGQWEHIFEHHGQHYLRAFPDIVIELDEGKVVIDAKYKRFGMRGRHIPEDDDILQMHRYLNLFDAKAAILIYPKCLPENCGEGFNADARDDEGVFPMGNNRKTLYWKFFDITNINEELPCLGEIEKCIISQ